MPGALAVGLCRSSGTWSGNFCIVAEAADHPEMSTKTLSRSGGHRHAWGMTSDHTARAVVDALTDAALLPRDRSAEAVAVVDRVLGREVESGAPLRRRFAEIAGYVGGAFVVGAATLFFGQSWSGLSVGQQVGVLVGIAVLLGAVGVVLVVTAGGPAALRRTTESVRRRLASVLLTGAAASAAFGAGVLLADGTAEEDLVILVASALALVVCLAGYALAATTTGQLGAAIAAVTGISSGLSALPVESETLVALGMSMLALGVLWLVLTEGGVWSERTSGRVIGCTLAVVGGQLPLMGGAGEWVAYVATFVVGAVAFGVYVVRRAWPYLATGVVALTLAVPEALYDWAAGSLGAAGVLLATGVTLLGAALFGLRLRREVAH